MSNVRYICAVGNAYDNRQEAVDGLAGTLAVVDFAYIDENLQCVLFCENAHEVPCDGQWAVFGQLGPAAKPRIPNELVRAERVKSAYCQRNPTISWMQRNPDFIFGYLNPGDEGYCTLFFRTGHNTAGITQTPVHEL